MIRRKRLSASLVNFCCLIGLLTVGSGLTCGQDAAGDNAKEDDPHAGHSIHGEAFNEGPRQEAYLMEGPWEGTGDVTFPASTNSERAQKFINQGVGQLHGFWYFEAERSFRQAAAIDPDCATAYWGMAMANTSNSKRAKGFIKEAMERRKMAGEREQQYIEALNKYLNADRSPEAKDRKRREEYVEDLEKIALAYPDDLEAKAFLALQIYFNRRSVPIQSYLATDALLKQILAKNPKHPVHHYIIHLWDYKKPELALESAARCGQSAPSIAHMWHMPGHTYSRLHRYHDAAWHQEASARVDHAHMIRDRVLPDQIHNFAHNNEWFIRNLLHTGRIHDAVDLAKNMTELPRHPKYNTVGKRGSSAYYGRLRLFSALNQNEMWPEMIQLCHTPYLEPTDSETEQVKRLRHLGRAYYQSGDLKKAQEVRQKVEDWKAELDEKKLAAQRKAEDKIIEQAKERFKQMPGQSDEDYERALVRESAKRIQSAHDKAAKPFARTLSSLDKTLKEFRGQKALADGDYGKAYDLLKSAGGQETMFLALVKLWAGETDEALRQAEAYQARQKNETIPLAQLIHIQWKAGRKTAAKKSFEELRKISETIDLDTPIFARLAPIAQELGLPEDWRLPMPQPDDIGKRPELAELGPFRWHPSQAEAWSLPDKDGNVHSLSDYRGKPVVVIFYLGFGCLHCVEQLKAFAPKAEEFEKQGLELIAISTESKQALEIALKNYNEEQSFAFPLVADPENKIFKAYRAYDDFEDQPLHGTFLIDAKGRVRWHDISYEPFMEPDFVLEEAERLLEQTESSEDFVTVKTLKPAGSDANSEKNSEKTSK